ncbi:MAG: hypothetical protein M0009_06560 [Deltaproteobacteria bacterium]|nr:hypothetical protein [Deltaproteobacteria bacterium]
MKPILTVMPDYGSGPYLWILKEGSPDSRGVGPNIASYECWPNDDFLSHVTQEVKEDFDDWVLQFEHYADLPQFNWGSFHKRGLVLARRLKAQLGDRAIIRYVKPMEDPNHGQDEIMVIE